MSDQQIKQLLTQWVPEELGLDPVSAGCDVTIEESDTDLRVSVTLGYPVATASLAMADQVRQLLASVAAGRTIHVHVDHNVQARRTQGDTLPQPGVSNVIAVSSGKGGVGKSTTAVNLALALQAEGARVGVLDADVFGPSVPTLLGVPDGTKPSVRDNRFFLPVMAQGLQTMSMGYMIEADTPVVWRGPKASGGLVQLFSQTLWDNLDYLVVDMPPGTGDIQLTLAQKMPVAGAVIVTTPQDLALADAIKGIEMFRKVGIGVLGVVENMAVHICSECGHAEHIFGQGGAAKLEQKYQAPLLGALPLALSIREQADAGVPTVTAAPDSPEADLYRQLARRVAARLSLQAPIAEAFPRVITKTE